MWFQTGNLHNRTAAEYSLHRERERRYGLLHEVLLLLLHELPVR
jgi:hypothetical protein